MERSELYHLMYILSLLGKRGVMRVNKISYVVVSGTMHHWGYTHLGLSS